MRGLQERGTAQISLTHPTISSVPVKLNPQPSIISILNTPNLQALRSTTIPAHTAYTPLIDQSSRSSDCLLSSRLLRGFCHGFHHKLPALAGGGEEEHLNHQVRLHDRLLKSNESPFFKLRIRDSSFVLTIFFPTSALP